jgi:hypothetical protein
VRPIVLVRWHDAIHPVGEWTFSRDLEKDEDALAETVGWLLHQSEKTVQVAVTLCDVGHEDEQFTGMMTIPMGCVERIVSLRHGRTIYRRPKP